jgi:large subunit ribosomal protein L3
MKFILGKKIGMSRIFRDEEMIPVTLLLAGPCYVTQVKAKEKDGYEAVQIGFNEKKNITKPERGHLNKIGRGVKNLKYLREFKIEDAESFKLGQEIKVSVFSEGDRVAISGFSKGKGFTGVVKRHGFHGAPASHGHRHDHRAPGSIGSAFPEHVFKGMKMAGRAGNNKVTEKNLEVVNVDEKKNLLAVKGAVPGARNSLVIIRSQ